MVSHRSGETVDKFHSGIFSQLPWTGQLKDRRAVLLGACREKYNQLMRIEEELGEAAIYAGRKAFAR